MLEEAVIHLKHLAASSPDFRHPLASGLTLLGIWRSALGRHDEAASVHHDAEAVYRQLVRDDPEAHLPDLAAHLRARAGQLPAQRLADRLCALDEAAALYRRLARTHPAEHLANLGSCLANLVKCLDAAGRKTEAFATAEETVAVYRQLAAGDSHAHLGCLATGLSDLAARLGPHTRLVPLREAVSLHRRLAGSDPDGRPPRLAAALHSLAAALDELGDRDEARSVRAEADAVADRLTAPGHGV